LQQSEKTLKTHVFAMGFSGLNTNKEQMASHETSP